MIYGIVEDEDRSHIKIGVTGQADINEFIALKRLAALQCGNPRLLVLVALAPGDVWRERELHLEFSSLLVRGEWFRHEGQVKEWAFRWRLERSLRERPPAPPVDEPWVWRGRVRHPKARNVR
jgi:hypothetical protein